MDDDLYFSRTSRPQDTARGSGMVFYDDRVGRVYDILDILR